MTSALRKWKAVFTVFFQDGIAYRASGIIWIMTDLVTAVTMPLVWAHATAGKVIAGFTTSDFVLYYLCLLLLQSFITSHIMWDLAIEIKEGNFTTALLRPVSFFQYTFLRNISWRVIRMSLFAPMFIILLFVYRGYLGGAHVYLGWEFWASLILGHLVSFTFVIMMAMLALFVQESQAIFELYYVPMMFLSGQLFPVSVMPGWARSLVPLFPFYYTTGCPTEILIGRVSGAAAIHNIAIQGAWVVVSYSLYRVFWAKGLKHYTAVGM